MKIRDLKVRAVAAPMKRPLHTSIASVTVAMLVVSGRFIGAATARTLRSRIFIGP